ncbi:transcriptional regulator GlxA family with amidase domain [Spinactinospora alkalitolerans]|uniref:Transcriptional regulator GlxA family with amidase domain n=1 Tax=Spinactinospora alkalitolerans TaxID=687207 RepID=A0A852TX55_9ACTN|nr:DJ-1/PfpI family protein [Spinactinospora alkalitolerans]NYE47482.1 transcriptional regulator GlxA family with amidase domain [Spinactinospora alkalitolerans]
MLAQIVLFDGFDLMDAVAPYEVLSAGGSAAGGALTVETVSAEGPRLVPSGSPGVGLTASSTLDPHRADLVVFPGASGKVGGEGPDTIAAVLARVLETELQAGLKAALEEPGLTVATVCGGSLLPALSGFIPGRNAVTHRMAMDVLASTGATAVAARVVDDGDLVTAGGVTSGLDLGLYLLERELGPRIARAVEELFEYERRGTVWRPEGPVPVAP